MGTYKSKIAGRAGKCFLPEFIFVYIMEHIRLDKYEV